MIKKPDSRREYLAPTDILSIIAMILIAGLYGLTREPDLKQALLGMVLFLAGRQSKTRLNGNVGESK